MSVKSLGLMILVALGLGTDNAQAAGERFKALVTWVDDRVTVSSSPEGAIRQLRDGELIVEGTKVHLPAGQKLGLLCSSDHWIELRGSLDWILTPDACEPGELDLGTFRWLVADAGRYDLVAGIWVKKRPVRDDPDRAIALSPRRTAVRQSRPTVVWRALHPPEDESGEYEIEISGLETPHFVPAQQAGCRIEPAWGNLRVCTAPWPQGHPGLEPGRVLFWNVGYRASIAAPMVREKESARVSRPSHKVVEQLEASLEKLAARPLNPIDRSLVTAGLLAEKQLYAEAIEELRQIPETDPTLQIAIGDLYLAMELNELADELYQNVLDATDDPLTEAAAAYGLGRSATALRQFEEAIRAFGRASELYATDGYNEYSELAREAQTALERAPGR